MTWKQLKINTLQKMFEIQGDTLVEDELTRPYIKSMPAVANEALQLLCMAGRYERRTLTIEQTGGDGDSEADVVRPVRDGVWKYDLAALVPDFYSLWRVYVRWGGFDGPDGNHELEGESVLVLPGDVAAVWTVYYNAYPVEIKGDTPDDTELPLHREVCELMPLYMASQLYKDDDPSLSAIWRNEFEAARQVMADNARRRAAGGGRFTSTTGWW